MRRYLILSVCLLALIGCEPEGIGADWKRIEHGHAAPDFSLAQLDAEGIVRLSDYHGRIVIMEFWATWCGPCRFSTPALEVIYKKYRKQGVSVLLINQQEGPDRIRKWAEQRFTAPILLDDGQVASRYGVQGIPRLFIVDQTGHFAWAHEGYSGGFERNLSLILDGMFAEPEGTDGANG